MVREGRHGGDRTQQHVDVLEELRPLQSTAGPLAIGEQPIGVRVVAAAVADARCRADQPRARDPRLGEVDVGTDPPVDGATSLDECIGDTIEHR